MQPQPIQILYNAIYDQYLALLGQKRRGERVNDLELTRLAMQTASIRVHSEARRAQGSMITGQPAARLLSPRPALGNG